VENEGSTLRRSSDLGAAAITMKERIALAMLIQVANLPLATLGRGSPPRVQDVCFYDVNDVVSPLPVSASVNF
jgi:hypothetical protein